MDAITTWYNTLEPTMRVYWGIAIFASLVFIIQMVLTFIGIGDSGLLAVGEVLTMPLASPLRELRIFVDHSSVEIFVNDGEETFTAHVYPTEKERYINVTQPEHMVLYSLRASVKDDFVI